jgi:hypothetical protein
MKKVLSTNTSISILKYINKSSQQNSLYVNGVRNANFKVPHLISQVVIGEPMKHKNKSISNRANKVSPPKAQIKNNSVLQGGKSRNVGDNLYKANNSMLNNGVIEVFGSMNKSVNNESKSNAKYGSATPVRRLEFNDYSTNSVMKQEPNKNFFEGSMDNPLRTVSIDPLYRSFSNTLPVEDDMTAFHVKKKFYLEQNAKSEN